MCCPSDSLGVVKVNASIALSKAPSTGVAAIQSAPSVTENSTPFSAPDCSVAVPVRVRICSRVGLVGEVFKITSGSGADTPVGAGDDCCDGLGVGLAVGIGVVEGTGVGVGDGVGVGSVLTVIPFCRTKVVLGSVLHTSLRYAINETE